MSKDVSDETSNGLIWDYSGAGYGGWFTYSYYRLNEGTLNGHKEVGVDNGNSVYAKQKLSIAQSSNPYSFRADSYVEYDSNPNDNNIDMAAEAYAYDVDTGNMKVEQSVSSGSASAYQHFIQTGGSLTDEGEKYTSAYKNLNTTNNRHQEYAEAYVDWTNNVEAIQRAYVNDHVKAEQTVYACNDDDNPWIYTYAYTDSDTDERWEEYAKSYVYWVYPANPVSGTIIQSASTGSAEAEMTGNLTGDVNAMDQWSYTDYDDDSNYDDYAKVVVSDFDNDTIVFNGHCYANGNAYAELSADVTDTDNGGNSWNWYERAWNQERANDVISQNTKTGNDSVNLYANSTTPVVNPNP